MSQPMESDEDLTLEERVERLEMALADLLEWRHQIQQAQVQAFAKLRGEALRSTKLPPPNN